MKTAISSISSISNNCRATCKSEQSITPLRVPCNGGSQQNCLSKKSYHCENLIESVLIEYKQLCSWVIREITQKLDQNQAISKINTQLFQFERFLSKKLDSYAQEVSVLKMIHSENQNKIKQLNVTNEDLKEKLQQVSNNLSDPLQTCTPLKKKQNYSIELITKQPLRNKSYSLQVPGHDKENIGVYMTKKVSLKPKFKI
ncbi:unnamed protein product (macronuclear) [Paramecium tetraurelia]|uniref:Uncharacterized protein n=1 Tax=Paramecium tetraurelia TaxID=5888 RepID=A0DX65_PARTE|nr:uncharacterized protein GSPATT00021264001 [Paramecium tetraurelia]CAK87632.1 unnamed protein product [Paramecium tetraurelia]|eukprot:XP_001455029.1 hypothetical protein (macronuclear) [Paramecium tetraurelia strain d4-2]